MSKFDVFRFQPYQNDAFGVMSSKDLFQGQKL